MENYIGQTIRELRKERGITQEVLADAMGVSIQTVSKWESGSGYPDILLLGPLAQYFHVSTDVLLGVSPADHDRIRRGALSSGAVEDVWQSYTRLQEHLRRFPFDRQFLLESLDCGWKIVSPDSDFHLPDRAAQVYQTCLHQGSILLALRRDVNDIEFVKTRLVQLHASQRDFESAQKLADEFPLLDRLKLNAFILHDKGDYMHELS